MKALKSPLARKVLADPEGQAQLRRFLTAGASQSGGPGEEVIEVRDDANRGKLRLVLKFVAKAS
ncbi:MAG TPA: hypothetical protein VD865_02985 [Stenotrophomonas sp.]|nr:hypothetical protein [Stenotrophomonas sp.]